MKQNTTGSNSKQYC